MADCSNIKVQSVIEQHHFLSAIRINIISTWEYRPIEIVLRWCWLVQSTIIPPQLGVIHQSCPKKNWLFGHPPPPPAHERPDRIAQKKVLNANILLSGRLLTGKGGGVSNSDTDSETQIIIVCGRPVDGWPPPSEVVHTGSQPPLPLDRMSLMDGPLQIF